MARLFISYAREDLAAAQAFATALGDVGHEVWWDREIVAGARFSREIDAALRNAEVVIVLWSAASIDSVWVQDEAAEGLEDGRLVPTLIDGCKPPLGFRQYQSIDMRLWGRGGAAFDPLVAAIAARASGQAKSAPPPSKAPAEASPPQLHVCVVPFTNMSSDAEQDYFGRGITEDVITDLSRVSALQVIAPPDLGGARPDPSQLARELGVTHVVEGSVRKSASRLRITAQLIEASSARHLWAERYDRDISDIFEIQDEIAKAIVAALQLKLLPAEQEAIEDRSTSDATAYDAYLKARQSWISANVGNRRPMEKVVALCGEATSIDPAYGLAWGLMALAQAEVHFWHGQSTPALVCAERALALNPHLPEPYCVRARHFEEAADDEQARSEIDKALRASPDSWDANREAGCLMFRRGELKAAIAFLETAMGVMKTDHGSAASLIACYAFAEDSAGMRRAAEIAVARAELVIIADPANGSAYASAARGLAALGEADRAGRWLRKALAVDPGNLAVRYSAASTLSTMLGNADAALDVLEPFLEAATIRPHIRLLEVDPAWASLRDRPAFARMVQQANKRVAAATADRPIPA